MIPVIGVVGVAAGNYRIIEFNFFSVDEEFFNFYGSRSFIAGLTDNFAWSKSVDGEDKIGKRVSKFFFESSGDSKIVVSAGAFFLGEDNGDLF